MGATDRVPPTTWTGCYRAGWQGLLVPEAFAHPAKYARGLIQRIYQHLRDAYGLVPGSVVLDPFGGVALGAHDACLLGYTWLGVELEPRFVTLGEQNLALWRQRYGHLPGYGTAVVLQGDSRSLGVVLAAAGIGQAGCVVSSPPYADGAQHTGGPDLHPEHIQGGPLPYVAYGATPGQLAGLPTGEVADVILSSPPYEASVSNLAGNHGKPGKPTWKAAGIAKRDPRLNPGYGETPGNVGNLTHNTFWSAAKTIVSEATALLPPGGLAVWVCKAFVRGGKLVDFPGDWQKLCEACGLVLVERIEASLVEDHGMQEGLFGESTQVQTARKSFFKRLAEKRPGAPQINSETVLILQKPSLAPRLDGMVY